MQNAQVVNPKFSGWMWIFWEISAFSARRVMQPMAVALGKWCNAAEDTEIFSENRRAFYQLTQKVIGERLKKTLISIVKREIQAPNC